MPADGDNALWEVVGGADKGGVLVRIDMELSSEAAPERLAFGSVVRQWQLVNDRLQYELVSGAGPEIGWVSIKLKGKDLLVRQDPNRLVLGSVLPAIQRTPRLPGVRVVPAGSRATYEKMGPGKAREPKVYVFLFPGAEDLVMLGWLRMECEAPPHVELATYEWPGHGSRSSEAFAKTLKELGDDAFEAVREPMSKGHCIVAGHSIGALLMTYVCDRAERELGRKPLAAIVLDRGAPHLGVLSEPARELLRDKPVEFGQFWCPHLKPDSDPWTARISDQPLDDDVLPVGAYAFPCRVHVLQAQWLGRDVLLPEHAATLEWAHRSGLTRPFSDADYLAWCQWAKPSELHFYRFPGVGHAELKSASGFLDLLYSEVDRILRGDRGFRVLPGLVAVLRDPEGEPGLDGQEVLCGPWLESSGRFEVRLADGSPKEVRPEHLQEPHLAKPIASPKRGADR